MFKCSAENLAEYVTTVTDFISKCMEDCTPKKLIFILSLYSLYTYYCVAKFQTNAIYKFADDTTVVGRISNNDEQLRKFGMSIRTLTNFYRYTTESILPGYTTTWYGNCSAQDQLFQTIQNCSGTQSSLRSLSSDIYRYITSA
eukprot:g38466.t1